MNTQSALDKNLASLLPKQLQAKDAVLQSGYEDFKKNVTLKALLILTEVIPERIRKFNESQPIEAPPGYVTNVSDFPECPYYKVPNVEFETAGAVSFNQNGKRIRTENPDKCITGLSEYIYSAQVPCNKAMAEKVQSIKNDASELMELVACVKLWIQLNIPKIEDGNNFGVAIQEDVISELSRVEDAAFGLRDSVSKYFANRAKLITKVVKYPNVEDYRLALRELDEKQWFQMKVTNMDTRNNYAIVYDMLHKNWQKVIKPRSTDGNLMMRIDMVTVRTLNLQKKDKKFWTKNLMSADYSFSLTTFSPSGKLVQIEYALNAVNKQGKPALGIKAKNGVVIASEKKVGSTIIDETSLAKVEHIVDHIGCVYAGMPADFRIILSRARKEAILYERTYAEPIPTLQLVKLVATIMQEFTQSGGVRPFGCSLLLAGYDADGPKLYQVDPSGAYFGWKATAIGRDMQTAKTFLERRYQPEAELDDAIHTAVLTLKESFEGALTENNIQIGIVGEDRKFRVLPAEEVKDFLGEVE